MTGFLHLGVLLISAGCLLLIDRRYRLFYWRDPMAALLVTAIGLVFFLGWDLAGIAAGVFLRGDSAFATGLVLAPQLPIEEPVFLLFLVQCIMVVYTGSARLLARRDRSRGTP